MKASQSYQGHSAFLLKKIAQKLHPKRFPRMSRRLSAILGYLFDEQLTTPAIVEIVVTTDGFVLAGVADVIGPNQFIGTYADLLRNWLALIAVAGLTTEERIAAEIVFASRIGYFGQADA